MMKHALLTSLLVFMCIGQTSCAVLRHVWPQKDIQPYELNSPLAEKRVLFASRSSEFKDAVVERIAKAFKGGPVFMKYIGIGQLAGEDGNDYDVVVLINSCIAWGIDPHVEAFLERHPDHENIILLTTSGDGNWLPGLRGGAMDAISSASEKVKVKNIADEIIHRIRSRFT